MASCIKPAARHRFETKRNPGVSVMKQITFGVRFIDALPPAPPELLPGLLPIDGVTLISGPTNIGKSLLAIEIASALTTGTLLWGHLPAEHVVNQVVYLLGEHTTGTVHRLYHVTGLPMGPFARIIGPDLLSEQKHVVCRGELNSEALERYRQYTHEAEFVIVDPLSAFVSGANAENDNAAMRHLVDAFSLLGQENHCPVLVLGHFGKPTRDQKSGKETHRFSYASRGASAAEDACPTVFYLRADEGETFRLHCRKYKGETIKDRLLLRNTATKVHTLLVSSRPQAEAQHVVFRQQVEQAMASGIEKTIAVKAVASLAGVSERTVWGSCSTQPLQASPSLYRVGLSAVGSQVAVEPQTEAGLLLSDSPPQWPFLRQRPR